MYLCVRFYTVHLAADGTCSGQKLPRPVMTARLQKPLSPLGHAELWKRSRQVHSHTPTTDELLPHTHFNANTNRTHRRSLCRSHHWNCNCWQKKVTSNKYWEVFLYLCTIALKTPHGHDSVICNRHHWLTGNMHRLPVCIQTVDKSWKRLQFCSVNLNLSFYPAVC